ncbi:MAG: hypothetical protein ACI9RU_002770 [Litorivivens sp.]|jgi:hypothetical protein
MVAFNKLNSMKRILLFLSIFFLAGSINMIASEARGMCELIVSYENQECGLMIFTASGFEPGTQLFWTINGDAYLEGTDVVTIQFESNDPAEVCVSYETMACPDGVFWCDNFTPSICEACPEDTFMDESEDCGCYSFEIGSFAEGENVTWDFGDGTILFNEGHFIEHCYSQNGSFTVIAEYSSQNCGGETYTLGAAEVECAAACNETSVEFESDTEAGGPTSLNWVIYDSMDNIIEEGECSFSNEQMLCDAVPCLEDGCYNLEITSVGIEIEGNEEFSLTLGDPVTYVGDTDFNEIDGNYQSSFNFGINTDCNPCSISGDYDQIDTDSYLFEVEVPEGFAVSWYINDDFIADGTALDYTFTPGEYTICAFHESIDCPLWWCVDIVVSENGTCPEDSGYVVLDDCGCFGFEIGSFVEGESVVWITSTGEVIEDAGHYQEICFEENGNFTVTALYSSPTCTEEEYAFVVDIDCFFPCTEVDFAFDSDVSQGGPFNVQYIVTDQNGETWESGACAFSGDIESCDATDCLPPGCYTVDLYAGDPLDNSNNFETGVFINGSEIDWFEGPTYDGNFHMQYAFSVDGGCEAGACSLEIQYDQFNGLNYNFTAEASDLSAEISWSFGDSTFGTGSFNSHTFPGPGEYEVCASYETDLCPEGVTECVTLYIEEEACTFVSVTISAELTGNDTDLLEFVLESEGVEIEGEWPLIAGAGTMSFDFCLEDGCYTLAVDPASAILANFIDIVITDEQGNELNGLIFGTGDSDELIIEFGVNTDCEDSVDELERGNVSVFPIPASDNLQINLADFDGASAYTLIDANGKLVKNGLFNGVSHTISVSYLSSGVYFLRVIGTTHTSTVRVVVE